MSSKITPSWIASVDQGLAVANSRIDALIEGVREQAAEFGQAQATANLALMVTTALPSEQLQVMLLAALHRLAFRDELGEPTP